MSVKNYENNQVIFRQGEYGQTMFELKNGSVGIFTAYGTPEERKLTEVTPGQLFGELALLEVYPRSATAVALSETVEAEEIGADQVSEYFKTHPDKVLGIMRNLSRRTRELTEDFAEVCAAIRELRQSDGAASEGLLTKIKRFVGFGTGNKKSSEVPSYEEKRRLNLTDSGEDTQLERFRKGNVIFRQGEPGDAMYDVCDGCVGIFVNYGTTDEKKLTELQGGAFFGEMGLIDHTERSATAVALENGTRVRRISEEDLGDYLEHFPAKVILILQHLSSRLRRLTDDYIDACRTLGKLEEAKENHVEPDDEAKKLIDLYASSFTPAWLSAEMPRFYHNES